MKKIICMLLVLSAVYCLTACAADDAESVEEITLQTEVSILEHAPDLTVQCDGDTFTVMSGNYSWTSRAVSGETGSVIACGSHPLDNVREREFRQVSGKTVTLSFPVDPDEITVIRWAKSAMGNTDRAGETVKLDGMRFPMEDGSWVYQVIAGWSRDAWGGQAEYHLYVTK